MGIYRFSADWWQAKKGRNLNLLEKAWWSSLAGVLAAIVGNPPDLCLVRFQTDGSLPIEERRNYKNPVDAMIRIVKEEGLPVLWRGFVSTASRAVAMNIGMLAAYDELKERLLHFKGTKKETKMDRIICSMCAGVTCAGFSLPFDNAKTKLQKMKPLPDGTLPYKGMPDCLLKTISREGFLGLWIGFPIYYSRVGPHAVITLLVQDMLHSIGKH